MTAIGRYARNFAKVAYHEENLDRLDDEDWRQINRIFKTFNPEYHAAITEYPHWVFQKKNMTPRDWRRCDQCVRQGEWPIFMFSHARIEKYLEQLQNNPAAAS